MLANAKRVYVLHMFTVEKRSSGWFYSKPASHGDKHERRGPYRSEASFTLMDRPRAEKKIGKRDTPYRV